MLGTSGAASRGQSSENLWRQYIETRDASVRNRLVECYLHVVKYHAERMHRRLPSQVDVDDLISAGVFGLMDAIDSFDLDRGVKFETFCARRVSGAILDELRSLDWAPRLVRSRTARVERVRRQLEQKLGRAPTDDEVAGAFDVGTDEYERIRRDSKRVQVTSLSKARFRNDSDHEVREMEFLQDEGQVDPLVATLRKDIKQVLTKHFSRAERLVIILYYYEQMTMREIGTTLNMSESRVSQLHSSIIARLKARQGPESGDLAAILAG